MRNIFSLISIFLFTILICTLHADELNVTGVWELTTDLIQQEVTTTYKFVQDGEKLLVTSIRKGVEGEILQGTVKGNEIEWTEIANINGQDYESIYSGVIEGDIITGELEIAGQYFDWTAKRKEK